MFFGTMGAGAVTLIGTNPSSSSDTRLLGIETGPFSYTELGLTAVPNISAIDFHPFTGVLYGTTGFGNDNVGWLYTISTTNWTSTLVGDTGYTSVSGLSFDDNTGILYGSATIGIPSNSSPDMAARLVTINTSTGAATLVGAYGASGSNVIRGMDSLAVNPLTGTLYGIVNNLFDSSADDFFQIDKLTGAATRVGSLTETGTGFSPPKPITGLDFDSAGNLYGSLGGNDGRIVSIDLNTLQYTYLGDARPGSTANGSQNSVSSIAVAPEPSRVLLLGMAFTVLLLRRRR